MYLTMHLGMDNLKKTAKIKKKHDKRKWYKLY